MKKVILLFVLIATLALVNTASAATAINITDAEAIYETNLASVNVPTSPYPIKTVFVINTDASLDKTLSTVSIPTQPLPVKEIFVINEDATFDENLYTVNIPTEPSPVREIFLHNAEEAILTKNLVPMKNFPTFSISTDKTSYITGDTMDVTIYISNPTTKSVRFEWYFLIPQFSLSMPVAKTSIPAGYDDTINLQIKIGDWGSMPFSGIWFVHLLDPTGGEVLSQDATCWIYSFTTQDLGVKAANLAKQVVGAPYLWGGKGWNWNPAGGWKWEEGQFVKPENGYPSIKGGYYYYSPTTGKVEFGKGLDCSGLSFWAFNKAATTSEYPLGKPLDYECPVYYEGAHGQWTDKERLLQLPKDTPIDKLKPGDLLFFDTDKNERMDHVIMYVGDGDVVHAEGVIYDKIVKEKLDTVLERYEDYFCGYGRVKTVPMERMIQEEIANEIVKTAEEVEILI